MKNLDRLETLKNTTGASTGCGWMVDDVAFLLYSLVKFYKPELVIQTGHLWGKSMFMVLEALTDGFLETRLIESSPVNADKVFSAFTAAHSPKFGGKRAISMDPEPMCVPHPVEGIDYLKKCYPGVFEHHKMKSEEFFAQYGSRLKAQYQGKRIFGIVDGGHSEEACRQDLTDLSTLGAGMMVVDDTQWIPGLGYVSRSFAAEHGYQFLEFPQYNGVGILVKTSEESL